MHVGIPGEIGLPEHKCVYVLVFMFMCTYVAHVRDISGLRTTVRKRAEVGGYEVADDGTIAVWHEKEGNKLTSHRRLASFNRTERWTTAKRVSYGR